MEACPRSRKHSHTRRGVGSAAPRPWTTHPYAVSSADRPDLRDRPSSLLAGGLRNTHIRIGDAVARIDTAEHGALPKEAALHRRVGATIRVPAVLDAWPGAMLIEYVPHADLPGSREAGEQVGRTAAAIHAIPFDHAGFLDDRLDVPAPFPSAYDGLRDWCDGMLAGEPLAPWRKRISEVLDAAEDRMRESSQQAVLVHADFKPANVKWLPNERDVVVFDWEFAWSGPALMDLGQMIRWGVPDEFVRGLETGYGNLPDDWLRLAQLFDLFNMVAFIADGEGRPLRTRDAVARLEKTLA